MTTTIWHNPRCSKSRQTLTLLEERGISAAVRLYLDDAPSTTEVAEVLNQLGIAPWELLRRGEKVFKELGLDKNTADQVLIEAMSANPILIERPIVIHGGRAAAGERSGDRQRACWHPSYSTEQAPTARDIRLPTGRAAPYPLKAPHARRHPAPPAGQR